MNRESSGLCEMPEYQAIPEFFSRLPWASDSDKDEVTSSNLVRPIYEYFLSVTAVGAGIQSSISNKGRLVYNHPCACGLSFDGLQ
jgi:hypothetical protein